MLHEELSARGLTAKALALNLRASAKAALQRSAYNIVRAYQPLQRGNPTGKARLTKGRAAPTDKSPYSAALRFVPLRASTGLR
jgi:hypothetical protein